VLSPTKPGLRRNQQARPVSPKKSSALSLSQPEFFEGWAWATLLLAMKVMMPPARVRASIAEAKILRIVPSYGVRGFDALIQLEAMIAVPMISGIRDTS
jgi:hypothetical protein